MRIWNGSPRNSNAIERLPVKFKEQKGPLVLFSPILNLLQLFAVTVAMDYSSSRLAWNKRPLQEARR